jgi:hypothetical protein
LISAVLLLEVMMRTSILLLQHSVNFSVMLESMQAYNQRIGSLCLKASAVETRETQEVHLQGEVLLYHHLLKEALPVHVADGIGVMPTENVELLVQQMTDLVPDKNVMLILA